LGHNFGSEVASYGKLIALPMLQLPPVQPIHSSEPPLPAKRLKETDSRDGQVMHTTQSADGVMHWVEKKMKKKERRKEERKKENPSFLPPVVWV